MRATAWDSFANAFGLDFGPSYNGIIGTLSITGGDPLLAGVSQLYFKNGNTVGAIRFGPERRNHRVPEWCRGSGAGIDRHLRQHPRHAHRTPGHHSRAGNPRTPWRRPCRTRILAAPNHLIAATAMNPARRGGVSVVAESATIHFRNPVRRTGRRVPMTSIRPRTTPLPCPHHFEKIGHVGTGGTHDELSASKHFEFREKSLYLPKPLGRRQVIEGLLRLKPLLLRGRARDHPKPRRKKPRQLIGGRRVIRRNDHNTPLWPRATRSRPHIGRGRRRGFPNSCRHAAHGPKHRSPEPSHSDAVRSTCSCSPPAGRPTRDAPGARMRPSNRHRSRVRVPANGPAACPGSSIMK